MPVWHHYLQLVELVEMIVVRSLYFNLSVCTVRRVELMCGDGRDGRDGNELFKTGEKVLAPLTTGSGEGHQ